VSTVQQILLENQNVTRLADISGMLLCYQVADTMEYQSVTSVVDITGVSHVTRVTIKHKSVTSVVYYWCIRVLLGQRIFLEYQSVTNVEDITGVSECYQCRGYSWSIRVLPM
jgi:hypothetical protein